MVSLKKNRGRVHILSDNRLKALQGKGIIMRRKDREIKDTEDIINIVSRAKILHLGLIDKVYPYIVPLHYGYEFTGGKFVFFMHCAGEGKKLELIRNNPNVCIELECDAEIVSGGDVPCRYGSLYSSFIGYGNAEIVSDEQEKIKGLKLLMKNQTDRDFDIDSRMTSAVEIIKVTACEFTAKSRNK